MGAIDINYMNSSLSNYAGGNDDGGKAMAITNFIHRAKQ